MPVYPELGDSGDPPNGNRWLMLGENSKYAYIVGFLEGIFLGHCFTTWGLPRSEPNDPAYLNSTKSYNDHWNRFVAKVTYRQFFDGLNKFYADHRNRRIEIQNSMWIVMSDISGQPSGTMESMIEAWRRKAVREAPPEPTPEPDPTPKPEPMPETELKRKAAHG
jgi:hypothetical protein